MESASDRALLDRLRQGEVAAFDQVYEDFRPRIYSFLVRLSRRKEIAEELVQETFIRLAARSTALAEDTKLAAWLFTVARNLYVSHLRATMMEAERIDRMSLEDPDHVPTPFEQAAATETQKKLERALASMPESYREVLLLVAVENLEPAEAATVVGITPEALRQRLTRARGMLRTALAEAEQAPKRAAQADRNRMEGRGT